MIVPPKKYKRINFLMPEQFAVTMTRVANELQLKESELIRQAIIQFIEEQERKKIEKEMIEACSVYFATDMETAKEWQTTETEV